MTFALAICELTRKYGYTAGALRKHSFTLFEHLGLQAVERISRCQGSATEC